MRALMLNLKDYMVVVREKMLKKYWRPLVALLVIISVPIIYTVKRNADYVRMDREAQRLLDEREPTGRIDTGNSARTGEPLIEPGGGRPMLLDLGATTCIPCKEMQPILDELKQEYDGRVTVQIVDVYEHRDWAQKYKVYLIPTQIFFDAQGKELYRHTGFYSRGEILAKFREYGWAE